MGALVSLRLLSWSHNKVSARTCTVCPTWISWAVLKQNGVFFPKESHQRCHIALTSLPWLTYFLDFLCWSPELSWSVHALPKIGNSVFLDEPFHLICCFCGLPSDGSDLDTVSHGSLDSANDSVERTSIDTDFTKMDSSDDGFSTGRKLCLLPLCCTSTHSFLLKTFYFDWIQLTFNK